MRARRGSGLAALCLAAWLPVAGGAQGSCRQALALALDVSGSVDAREYRLQIDGLIAALDSSGVRNALLSQPDRPVDLLVFEWSGANDQHILVDWTSIRDAGDIASFQEALAATRRRVTSPGTAIGHALQTGHRLLDRRADCARRTLDVSGDGTSNLGPEPADVRTHLAEAGITINALVIGADTAGIGDLRQAQVGELSAYFRDNVIAGEEAFVQTAVGYEAYAEAMARKLEKELQTMVVSSRAP